MNRSKTPISRYGSSLGDHQSKLKKLNKIIRDGKHININEVSKHENISKHQQTSYFAKSIRNETPVIIGNSFGSKTPKNSKKFLPKKESSYSSLKAMKEWEIEVNLTD
jgi:hypothetical protein